MPNRVTFFVFSFTFFFCSEQQQKKNLHRQNEFAKTVRGSERRRGYKQMFIIGESESCEGMMIVL